MYIGPGSDAVVATVTDSGPGFDAEAVTCGAGVGALGGDVTISHATDAAAQAQAVLADLDRPDLVMIDVNLETSSGIDLARQLAAADPTLRIVLVSTMEECDLPSDAHDAGVIGFVEKSQLGPELISQMSQGW